MATVFVAGASGYIGSNVAIAFRAAGYRVYGLVRSKEKGAPLVPREVIPVVGDLEDPKTYLEVVDRASIIVDTTAIFSSQGGDFVSFNRQLLNATAASGAKSGIKKTYIYTSGVLVNTHSLEVRDETAPLERNSPFTILNERMGFETETVNHSGVRGIVIRLGIVYGGPATSGPVAGNVLTRFFNIKDKVQIPETLRDKRWNWVHVADVADAYVRAAKKAHIVHGEVFNIVADASPTYEQIVLATAKIAGFNGPVEYVTQSEDLLAVVGNKTVLLSHDKARDLLDWVPQHKGPLEELDIHYHTIKNSW